MKQLKDLQAGIDTRCKHRIHLIRIRRAEGFLGVDAAIGSLLAAPATAGVFRLGGTHADPLYEGFLGVRFAFDQMAQAGDIDIAGFERLSFAGFLNSNAVWECFFIGLIPQKYLHDIRGNMISFHAIYTCAQDIVFRDLARSQVFHNDLR